MTIHFQMPFPAFKQAHLQIVMQEQMLIFLRPEIPVLIGIFQQIRQYHPHDPVRIVFVFIEIEMRKEVHGVDVMRNCDKIIRFIDSPKRQPINSQNFYLCHFNQTK